MRSLQVFPPLVSGVTIFLIGAALIGSGFQDWGGAPLTSVHDTASDDDCLTRPMCIIVSPMRALPWEVRHAGGAFCAEYINGLPAEALGCAALSKLHE